MAEMNKGIISEEALGEIAGGLNVSKEKVISTLKKVGVGIGAAAAVTAALGGAFVAGDLVGEKLKPIDWIGSHLPKGEGKKAEETPNKNLL